MLKTIAIPFAFAIALTGAAHAMGTVELTDDNKDQIHLLLTAEGYEVGKIKIEDGMYEAYAKKDGRRYEIFLNGDFEIVKTKDND